MKRLILFDIDGTILSTQGVGRRALTEAVSQAFGVDIDSESLDLSGKTDPQICREMLDLVGYPKVDDWTGAYSIYLPILEKEISLCKNFALLPGINELIAALDSIEDCHLALLTGNIEPGARIKLSPFDLNKHFSFGAFGSDSANRLELPRVAHKRALDNLDIDFEPQEMVVIGDSTRDVDCAKAYGASCLAVSSGRTSKEELGQTNPEFLFSSLEDTDKVIEAIFSGPV